VILDTPRFRQDQRPVICTVICALGWLLSTMYATSLGTYLLDVIDHYVSLWHFMIVSLVAFEHADLGCSRLSLGVCLCVFLGLENVWELDEFR
jgi:hypothetical protein